MAAYEKAQTDVARRRVLEAIADWEQALKAWRRARQLH